MPVQYESKYSSLHNEFICMHNILDLLQMLGLFVVMCRGWMDWMELNEKLGTQLPLSILPTTFPLPQLQLQLQPRLPSPTVLFRTCICMCTYRTCITSTRTSALRHNPSFGTYPLTTSSASTRQPPPPPLRTLFYSDRLQATPLRIPSRICSETSFATLHISDENSLPFQWRTREEG